MRSWAWMVLGSGGTVGSSREATSHVGVSISCSSASVSSGGPPGSKGLDDAADRHGRGEQVAVDRGHLHGHVAAVAAAGDVDPLAVDRVAADEIADDLADERGEAGAVLDPVGGALRGHDIGAAEDPLCLLAWRSPAHRGWPATCVSLS